MKSDAQPIHVECLWSDRWTISTGWTVNINRGMRFLYARLKFYHDIYAVLPIQLVVAVFTVRLPVVQNHSVEYAKFTALREFLNGLLKYGLSLLIQA